VSDEPAPVTLALADTGGAAPERVRLAPEPAMTADQVQEFLTRKNSGLAKLKIETPHGFMTVGAWVHNVASAFALDPLYLLAVIQKEQSLIGNPVAPSPEIKIRVLAGRPNPTVTRTQRKDVDPLPAVGVGEFAIRNGGPDFTTDGIWYLAVHGDRKLALALGFGAPDPGVFPPWDMRKYLGLPLQIWHAGRRTREWLSEFAKMKNDNPQGLIIKTYEGPLVVAADAATHSQLRYTPSMKVLTEFPIIVGAYQKQARAWGLV
jgi:hypothetical protein